MIITEHDRARLPDLGDSEAEPEPSLRQTSSTSRGATDPWPRLRATVSQRTGLYKP